MRIIRVSLNIVIIIFSKTCREDGTVQVWSVEDASLVSNYSLEQEV